MLKMRGITEVIVYCRDNGAVMAAWAKDQGVAGSIINFYADTAGDVTKALGMEMGHPGPVGVLGPGRNKRFAMFLDDGVIKVWNVSEKPDDPAGDNFPESSCVENMLSSIDNVGKEL